MRNPKCISVWKFIGNGLLFAEPSDPNPCGHGIPLNLISALSRHCGEGIAISTSPFTSSSLLPFEGLFVSLQSRVVSLPSVAHFVPLHILEEEGGEKEKQICSKVLISAVCIY